MLPPWMNLYSLIAMSTVNASVVGVSEMITLTAQVHAAEGSRPELLAPLYAFALACFFIYCYPIGKWTQALERRYQVGIVAHDRDGVWSAPVSWQYAAMKNSRKRASEPGDLATGSTAPRADAPLSIAAAIGVQIRQLRKRQDITAAELAHQAGLSAGMLSKIENGAVSASLESLESLARALNVPLTSFFATYEERRDCSYVPQARA